MRPYISIINTILIVLSFSILTVHIYNDKQLNIKYVNSDELFHNFNMYKDSNKIYQGRIGKQKKEVDSLYQKFQHSINDKSSIQVLKKNQIEFQKSNQKLQEINTYYSIDMKRQIWNRLNLYIHDYGVQHNYQLLLGMQKDFQIVFVDSDLDITDDLLEYCNNKYEGI